MVAGVSGDEGEHLWLWLLIKWDYLNNFEFKSEKVQLIDFSAYWVFDFALSENTVTPGEGWKGNQMRLRFCEVNNLASF